MTHKEIKIEIGIVEDDNNLSCAFYSETGEVINFNHMELDEKKRVVEALNGFAKLFSRGL